MILPSCIQKRHTDITLERVKSFGVSGFASLACILISSPFHLSCIFKLTNLLLHISRQKKGKYEFSFSLLKTEC